MNNTICIKHTKKTRESFDYYPFRWIENEIFAYVGKQWVRVEKTGKKNQYKDLIFSVSTPIEVYISR